MRKKNKKVVIIIILLVVLALLAGGAWAINEFVLNKPKDLFNKYTMQNFSEVFNFDTSLFSQIQNDNSGKTRQTKTDIEISGLEGIKLETDLRVDKQNNKSQIDINLKNDDDSILKVQGLRNADKYAFKSDPIANGYIGIENNKLDELAKKLNLDIENFPNKIEITKGDFESNKKKILSKLQEEYLPIIKNKFTDDRYSKEKNISVKIGDTEYQKATKLILSIDKKELKDVLKEILSKVQDDNELIEKMITYNIDGYSNEIKEEYKNQLTSLIESLDKLDSTGSVKINTYVENNKVIKTDIVFEDGENISVYKDGDKKKIIVTSIGLPSTDLASNAINIDEGKESKIEFSMKDSVSDGKQQVLFEILIDDIEFITINGEIQQRDNKNSMNLEIGLGDFLKTDNNSKYVLKINQTTEYKDAVEVDDLIDSNSMIINNYSAEQIQSLISQLIPLLSEVSENTIEKVSEAVLMKNDIH